LFDRIEEIEAFDGLAGHEARYGKTIEGFGAGLTASLGIVADIWVPIYLIP
jgi:hypothetical protein